MPLLHLHLLLQVISVRLRHGVGPRLSATTGSCVGRKKVGWRPDPLALVY